jgi:hypothetical protein
LNRARAPRGLTAPSITPLPAMRRSLAPSALTKRPKLDWGGGGAGGGDDDAEDGGTNGTQAGGGAQRRGASQGSSRLFPVACRPGGGCGWMGMAAASGGADGGSGGRLLGAAGIGGHAAARAAASSSESTLTSMSRALPKYKVRGAHAGVRVQLHARGGPAPPHAARTGRHARMGRASMCAHGGARRAARCPLTRPPPSPAPCCPQCPLPDAQLSNRGSLGLRRRYGAAGSDLLAALGRKVFITQQGGDTAGPAGPEAVGDLLLYDPDEDNTYQQRLQALREATAAADTAAAAAAAAEAAAEAAESGADAGAARSGDEGAGTASGGAGPAPTPGHAPASAPPGPAQGSSADGCGIEGWSTDSDDSQQDFLRARAAAPAASPAEAAQPAAAPLSGAAALRAAATQARAAAVAAHAAAAAADKAAGPARVKVYADAFLGQSLRPHQRLGVQFVFSRLCGTVVEGVSGGVLADGMGLGKTFQTVASLWCLLTKGIHAGGGPTCKRPLILCPSSLVQNWGKEFAGWLGDRVAPVVVDDTRAAAVKDALQVRGWWGRSRACWGARRHRPHAPPLPAACGPGPRPHVTPLLLPRTSAALRAPAPSPRSW